jgi:hypothetical protein
MKITNNILIGWTMISSALMWILQLSFVSLFYALSISSLGSLSDLTNILTMLLLIPFTIFLFRKNKISDSNSSLIALIFGISGIIAVAISSGLLIAGVIGFLDSLLPLFSGYVAYGISLLINLWNSRKAKNLDKSVVNWGLMVGLGLFSIIGLLTVDLGNLFSFNMDGLWTNPLIYPAFILTPFFFIGYPFWAIMAGRRILSEEIGLN